MYATTETKVIEMFFNAISDNAINNIDRLSPSIGNGSSFIDIIENYDGEPMPSWIDYDNDSFGFIDDFGSFIVRFDYPDYWGDWND